MTAITDSPRLRCEIQHGVGILTLCDPATLNAASIDMLTDLRRGFAALVEDDSVRSIMITAQGKGFCSGASMSPEAARARGTFKGPLPGLIQHCNPLLSALRKSPKPMIAAVNGVAAGFGVSLALACDIILAADTAYFLLAFRRIGMVPDGGASWLLPRLIGKSRTMELLLLGEKLPAPTALEWGLINRCVPADGLMEASMDIARAIASGPGSLGVTRQLVWQALDAEWHAQIEAEAYAQGDAMRSADGQEGMQAFREKRPAKFGGHQDSLA
ncbi:MAG: enoyl-CoA hydratase-related protein [Blastomonas sp.]